jgi:hypothetical protein
VAPPRFIWLVPLVVALATARPAPATAPPAYRVIVNPANPASAVDRRFVAEAFLKKTTRWSDGTPIRPADQGADRPARQRFSEEVIGRSVAAVKTYWQQAVFSGRDLPPPELDSDDDVVRWVLKHEGAIGYVSGAANVERVKALSLR